jgi:hypothetical protein
LLDIPYYIPYVGLTWIPVYVVEITNSSDGGESFDGAQTVSDRYALNSSIRPDVSASHGAVHVVFYRSSYGDSVIEYDRSTDMGNTWGTDRLVSGGNCCPSLGIDTTNRIHVALSSYRDGSQDIFHTQSTDGGQTFSPGVGVNDDEDAVALHTAPDLAVDSHGIHAIWSDNHTGLDHIYYARSSDAGLSFGTATQLDRGTDSNTRTYPSIVSNAAGRLHVIWAVERYPHPDWTIWYSGLADGGGDFSEPVAIASGQEGPPHPALAVDGNTHIHVVWESIGDSTGLDQYYIYHARSTDSGASFSTAQQINDVVDSDVGRPDIAVDNSGRICVVWQDARRGEWDTDIYLASAALWSPWTAEAGSTWPGRTTAAEIGTSTMPVPRITAPASVPADGSMTFRPATRLTPP